MIGSADARRALACLTFLAGFAWFASSVWSQQPQDPATSGERYTDWGRETHTVPSPSTEGHWDGTWFYISRDQRFALWFKTEDGVPQVKLRYASMNSGEGFETDWTGTSDYQLPSAAGHFSLGITRKGKDEIDGRWEWLLKAGKGIRLEEGDYRMYRTGDGRFLALVFDEMTRTVNGGKGKNKVYKSSTAWTFRKASKRLVLWDELPF